MESATGLMAFNRWDASFWASLLFLALPILGRTTDSLVFCLLITLSLGLVDSSSLLFMYPAALWDGAGMRLSPELFLYDGLPLSAVDGCWPLRMFFLMRAILFFLARLEF